MLSPYVCEEDKDVCSQHRYSMQYWRFEPDQQGIKKGIKGIQIKRKKTAFFFLMTWSSEYTWYFLGIPGKFHHRTFALVGPSCLEYPSSGYLVTYLLTKTSCAQMSSSQRDIFYSCLFFGTKFYLCGIIFLQSMYCP